MNARSSRNAAKRGESAIKENESIEIEKENAALKKKIELLINALKWIENNDIGRDDSNKVT